MTKTQKCEQIQGNLTLPPLSIYVHIPWCVRKCPYCDFNSHKSPQEIPAKQYLEALLEDFQNDLHLAQGRKIHSVFFGGGTPSLMPASTIAAILDTFDKELGFEERAEITLEANPGTTEFGNLSQLHSAGVNRLSFGVQSFNDRHLSALGRIHSAQEAISAYRRALDSGFTNINLDLMHGLPEQMPDEALADLKQAIELDPNHISWYQLTIETNTEFFSRPPRLPDDDTLSTIQDHGHILLEEAGYKNYEISAYAKVGRAANHNLNYWQFGDFLAIGAGAHGKITLPGEHKIVRFRKTRQPEHYMDKTKAYTASFAPIPETNLALEFMMNTMRLKQGVETCLYEQRTGQEFKKITPILTELVDRQLLCKEFNTRLEPTVLGQRYLNNLLEAFMRDN